MLIIISIIAIIVIAVLTFLHSSRFGSTPSGERKAKVEASANYREGKFQNLSYTPQLTSDKNYVATMADFLFGEKERLTPAGELPVVKTDLLNLDKDRDILVWFGHSSYFMQVDGKRMLVDPVFSEAASPVSFVNKAFKGTNVYKPEDIPDIDYLFISHDHWDHLDYPTVEALKDRIGKVICGLGVGEHFESWNFDKDKIVELDWNLDTVLDDGFKADCLPARHFSGRGLSPNQSLWVSFMLQTPTMKIYIGGDSGYDTFFSRIGEKYGEIDLAILENGQYNGDWKYIHMSPEETVKAAKDVHAKRLLPVHNSKFALAYHAWDTPLIDVTEAAAREGQPVITPMMGEVVNLKDITQQFRQWWVGIE
ncbi:L-ascorbate metabolism protein UlaG (beta-lactamase superfamily) [Dysgonomonas hofstadii]|uniref:L-ascorbate metabolism protein UlaG (Beta-lactamase superfamily) n=1 Tax=Dysgonomonas hofstadii TaxID=637886 RepID=A0A840CVZ8_9BACT|nr:MBL fold metallo-hydrolase [Dysgonomonas hofstadii]MBB4036985.1 L-ascorbate metabolism protein UlaG (beta-lactamase superfamily) [Dysgonomonas hofstadii]